MTEHDIATILTHETPVDGPHHVFMIEKYLREPFTHEPMKSLSFHQCPGQIYDINAGFPVLGIVQHVASHEVIIHRRPGERACHDELREVDIHGLDKIECLGSFLVGLVICTDQERADDRVDTCFPCNLHDVPALGNRDFLVIIIQESLDAAFKPEHQGLETSDGHLAQHVKIGVVDPSIGGEIELELFLANLLAQVDDALFIASEIIIDQEKLLVPSSSEFGKLFYDVFGRSTPYLMPVERAARAKSARIRATSGRDHDGELAC